MSSYVSLVQTYYMCTLLIFINFTYKFNQAGLASLCFLSEENHYDRSLSFTASI